MSEWSKDILVNIIQEIQTFIGNNVEGIVSFGSNAQLDNSIRLEKKDLDILVVVSNSFSFKEDKLLELISSVVYQYKIRLDIHIYTLSEFSRGLRNKDLLFLGISRNYKILYSTKRFNSVTQLLKGIGHNSKIKLYI